MISRLRFRRICSGFVVWVTLTTVVFGQEPLPLAQIEKPTGQVVVDPKGKPEQVNLEFGIKAGFVIAEARLFYRVSGATEFSQKNLKKNLLTLRYGASVPANTLEYFIELKPEKEPRQQIGTKESPIPLDTSKFERVTETRKLTKKQALFVGIWMIALVAARFLAGAVNGGKRR